MLAKRKLIRDKEIYERVYIGESLIVCQLCEYRNKYNNQNNYCKKFELFVDSLCGPRFLFKIIGYGIDDKIKYEYKHV